eukprot:COSAG01_NODE_242_length_20582_cov_314.397256_15_plen_387_part_00
MRGHLKLGARGASGDSPAPTVRRHSTAPAWATAEGWPERVRGAGPSPPRRQHIMATSYRWRSRCRLDGLSTPAAAPPATTLCHPGRLFSADGRRRLRISIGGDVVAIAVIPPPYLSLLFPCISCLAVCATRVPGGCPRLLTQRSIRVPVVCAGLAASRGGYIRCCRLSLTLRIGRNAVQIARRVCVRCVIIRLFMFTHSPPLHSHARRHPTRTRASSQPQRTARRGRQGFASSEGKLGRERWRGVHAATHPFEPFLTPVLDACERLVHTCQLLPTRNVAEQCRVTVKTHLLRSGKQLAAEYASCSHSQGLRKGEDAAPCSRRSQAWGGVSSSSPYLRATRPPGRVSCGDPATRIGRGQARRCGKEGKPVLGKATTIAAASSRGIPC